MLLILAAYVHKLINSVTVENCVLKYNVNSKNHVAVQKAY